MRLLLLLLATLSYCGKPNTFLIGSSYHYQDKKYDSISPDSVEICGLKFGDKIDDLVGRLGQPDTVERRVNEFDASISYYYKYGESSFISSESSQLIGFCIRSSDFWISLPYKIRIGDSVGLIKEKFPSSYSNLMRKDMHSRDMVMRVLLRENDWYILIIVRENRIVEILDWHPE